MLRNGTLRDSAVALLWVVGVAALSAWVIVARGPAINTNILDLLPSTDRDPVVLNAVDRVQRNFERHLAVVVGAKNFATAKQAADMVGARLKATDRFRKLRIDDYRDLVRNAVEFYLPQRFQLLGNATRSLLDTGGAPAFERSVLRRYFAPQSSLTSQLIDRDPMMLLPVFLAERSADAAGRPEIRDGYLTVRADNRVYIALVGELSETPFSVKVQRELTSVVEALRAALPRKFPGSALMVAGVLPHAAAGTQSGIDEMSTVGLGSLLAIVILLITLFRSTLPFLMTLTAIGLGCVSGFAACLAIFGEVHLLTLIFGSSLVGISVDYSFHYFCERFRLADNWSPSAARSHVFPGITLGLATSAIGFAGLFFAPFPGMKGMALFSIVGLSVAYGCVVLCYPSATGRLGRPSITRPLHWVAGYGALWRRRWGWPAYALAMLLAIGAVAGCFRLTASDDIRLMQTPHDAVMEEERRIRALIGRNLSSQFLIVEGRDAADYLQREEGLTAALRQLRGEGKIVGYLAISDFVASPQRQADNRRLIRALVDGERPVFDRIAARVGLPDETRDAYKTSLLNAHKVPPVSIEEWIAHPVSAPHRHLWHGNSGRGVVGIVGLRGVFDMTALIKLSDDDPKIHFVDPAGDVSELFGRYRHQTVWLTIASYCLVLLILLIRYRLVGGILVMAPPAIAAFLTLGILGLAGQPLSLFNVMALLLVLGIGVDYALFFRETGADSPTTLLAIALSSITTLLAFGLLAFSATTAIHAFGLTVLIGILAAFLLAPMSGWMRPAKKTTTASNGDRN